MTELLQVGKKQARRSLRKVFPAVVIATYLITALGATVVFYWRTCCIGDKYVSRFALSQNLLEKNRILSIVDREVALSRKLADDPYVVYWMQNQDDEAAAQDASKQLDSYKKFLTSATHFVGVLSNGHYYLDSINKPDSILDPQSPLDRWFYDTVKKNEDYSLNVNYDKVLNKVMVWVNVMVRDERGSPIGVAGSGMDLTDFLESLIMHNDPGISTIIINSDGELQAHKNRSLIEHNARVAKDEDKLTIYNLINDPQDRVRFKSAIAAASNGGDVQIFPLRMDGKTVVTALGSISELGWYNLVLVDGGSIMGFADFVPLGIVFFVSLLIVLASVIILLNRLVLSPLGALTSAAGVVAGGAYDITLPAGADNEIGTLSASFNVMTEKIRSYTANLEDMVAKRTAALAIANNELTDSQNRIMDSIRYARLIQNSILPADNELARYLSDYFVVLHPLDIVGGDFHFFQKTHDGFCIAAVDCTGHGVPGAFMTMMANALLNRVIETNADDTPGAMLEKLHFLVQETLRSELGVAHLENGLDIALCRVRPAERVLEFAGAGLPLLVVEDGKVQEIPGDRLHLGFSGTGRRYKFTEHRLSITEASRCYMFTDGILDLPGGERGFGLGRSGLMQIINEQAAATLKQQRQRILTALKLHRGQFLQRDDMMIIGFSVDLTGDK